MSRVKPAAAALLGFAQGFANSLLEGIQTERLRKAKELEMAQLREMQLQDRADERAFRVQDREDQQTFNAQEREAQLAARKEESAAEIAARKQINGADIAARREISAADNTAAAERARIAAAAVDTRSATGKPLYQLYQLPGEQTVRQALVGEPLPAGATLYGTAGVDVDLTRPTKGRNAGLMNGYGTAPMDPKDAFFAHYAQPK